MIRGEITNYSHVLFLCKASLVVIVCLFWLHRWIVCSGSWSLLQRLKDLDQDSRAVLLFSDLSFVWFFSLLWWQCCTVVFHKAHLWAPVCSLFIGAFQKSTWSFHQSKHNSDNSNFKGSFKTLKLKQPYKCGKLILKLPVLIKRLVKSLPEMCGALQKQSVHILFHVDSFDAGMLWRL